MQSDISSSNQSESATRLTVLLERIAETTSVFREVLSAKVQARKDYDEALAEHGFTLAFVNDPRNGRLDAAEASMRSFRLSVEVLLAEARSWIATHAPDGTLARFEALPAREGWLSEDFLRDLLTFMQRLAGNPGGAGGYHPTQPPPDDGAAEREGKRQRRTALDREIIELRLERLRPAGIVRRLDFSRREGEPLPPGQVFSGCASWREAYEKYPQPVRVYLNKPQRKPS